jgi:hypothetical protein
MTVSDGQQAKAVAPLASERLFLMGQAAGAKIELDRVIASMQDARNSIPAEIIAQQSDLAGLISQIATASAVDLPALKRAVATAVAAATNATQQMQAASSGQSGPSLADASEASRRSVQSALDYTRTLDLQFASAEDERAYRQREAERRSYIEAEQAKGTPEGNLNAAGATVGQMADAKAHGAGGPEFDQHVTELLETTSKLREAIRRSGKSTQDFDDKLRGELRRVMRNKGMTDAEIDAKFAANPDPLDAAKAYLTDKDAVAMRTSVEREAWQTDASTVVAVAQPVSTSPSTLDPFAKLRAAGLTASPHEPDADFAHGVTASASKPKPSRGQG